MTTATFRQQSRDLLADAIAARGSAWANTAENVRTGYENTWITPALDAIEGVLTGLRRGKSKSDEDDGA